MEIFKKLITMVLVFLPFSLTAYGKISFINLMIEPEIYENKNVSVMGYALDRPLDTLYLTKDHGKARDIPSSIPVYDMTKNGSMGIACRGSYVKVYGRVIKVEGGYGIGDITEIYVADGFQKCWTKEQGNIYPDGIVPNENPN